MRIPRAWTATLLALCGCVGDSNATEVLVLPGDPKEIDVAPESFVILEVNARTETPSTVEQMIHVTRSSDRRPIDIVEPGSVFYPTEVGESRDPTVARVAIGRFDVRIPTRVIVEFDPSREWYGSERLVVRTQQ